jgi:hypothetical protein
MPDGTKIAVTEGTPQGGPLSPLLSNIVLDELDWELERPARLAVVARERAARVPSAGVHNPENQFF